MFKTKSPPSAGRRHVFSFLPFMLASMPAVASTSPPDPFVGAWREVERLQTLMLEAKSDDRFWEVRPSWDAAHQNALTTAATSIAGIELKLRIIRDRIESVRGFANDEYRLLVSAMDDLQAYREKAHR